MATRFYSLPKEFAAKKCSRLEDRTRAPTSHSTLELLSAACLLILFTHCACPQADPHIATTTSGIAATDHENFGPSLDAAFYLGGGMAILLALVGWADQIKGLNRSARDREMELVETYGVKWGDLQVVIRPKACEDPLKRVVKLMHLFPAGLGDNVGTRLLSRFLTLETLRKRLELHYAIRYWVLLTLSAQMLVAGFHSATNLLELTWQKLYFFLSAGLTAGILLLTFELGRRDSDLQNALNSIEDDLRLARENRSRDL